ncbi:hypothetical protein [Alienimonas sp. DA493]|uniref:hypothetical protein n=1 Tax=Alienimonas sp. DA493 TaxID=3373605 RepID=UPI003754FA9B
MSKTVGATHLIDDQGATSYGSVDGTVRLIDGDDRGGFLLETNLSGPVYCLTHALFGDHKQFDGQRVTVSGRKHYLAHHPLPAMVEVTMIEPHLPKDEQPAIEDVRAVRSRILAR